MHLRDQGHRFCLSPDRQQARWLHPAEMKTTHSDWLDVTDMETDGLVALIKAGTRLPHGKDECLAAQKELPL